MDSLLAEPIETFMTGEGLFSFLEDFAAHVY